MVDHRVKLKRSGKITWPAARFTKKNPSFTVSPDKQFYYCFGQEASGNALGFIMEYDHQGFTDAVESAAKILGLTVPYEEPTLQSPKRSNLYTLFEQASQFYKRQLREHRSAKQPLTYLQTRGLTAEIVLFWHRLRRSGLGQLIKALGPSEQAQNSCSTPGLLPRRR